MPGRKERRLLLTDLVAAAVLQDIQDRFAEAFGVSTIIRDPEGRPIVAPSGSNEFCREIMKSPAGRERCGASNARACATATQAGEPIRYVCHAGLTQFAAPILIGGERVATIVIGDRPEGRLSAARVRRLAHELGLDPHTLQSKAAQLKQWSDEEIQAGGRFLQSAANVIADLAYQGFQLRERLREVSALYRTSSLLTSTLDLNKVLRLLAKTVTRTLRVKGCSIRLLDRERGELVVTSFYNLSRRYLDKGPVIVEDSVIDRAALRGKAVRVRDMQSDPRILYPKEAEEEGLRSGLAVGLIYRKQPIGTIHVYTGQPHDFTGDEVRLLRAMADQAASAIENARLFEQSRELARLDRELAVAAEIQRRLLPRACPAVPGFEVAALSIPCHAVGGDFYDFVRIGERYLALCIGDVSGKGVPGAILMAGAHAALRAQIERSHAPRRMLTMLNRTLCRDTQTHQFVTFFYGVLDLEQRELRYANAGHNPPLLLRGGGFHELSRGGLVLGVDETATYEEGRARMDSGDILVLYTDGVTETPDPAMRMYGGERLRDAVRRAQNKPSREIVQSVRRETDSFGGRARCDDFTLILVKAV